MFSLLEAMKVGDTGALGVSMLTGVDAADDPPSTSTPDDGPHDLMTTVMQVPGPARADAGGVSCEDLGDR